MTTAPDLSSLSDFGRQTYTAIDTALRTEVGRRLPDDLTADTAHRAAWIAVEAAVQTLRTVRDQQHSKDLRTMLAEDLADVFHDDEGLNAGMQFWLRVAGRLVDPNSPLVRKAVEQEQCPVACRTNDSHPHDPAITRINGEPRCPSCADTIDPSGTQREML
ncbi:hypothetical protein BDK92_7292 [Micromonospora pisi]|uniref:Uncharacterized protein n=1 Tax=Micromonospora pisi TaxID=589240 RepID=A0A495JUZ0_9ACTN|nr:hypothetical protein [Micromonospora pisi]RKR92810.1 hypothetical protein BDK92_7292 [Micromonospora pisi]